MDRGPFGIGRKVRYDGNLEDERSSGEDEDGQVFWAGPSRKSQQLALMEYAEKYPGRFAARLLGKIKTLLSREEGPMYLNPGKNLTPSSATSYLLTILGPTHRDYLTIRTSRELRTVAKVLDLLVQGWYERAADICAQRFKALELSLTDQGWSRA